MVAKDASSIKRLAYVARRVRFLQELESRHVIAMRDVDGTANPADMLTKHLKRDPFIDYASRMYNRDLRLVPSVQTPAHVRLGGVLEPKTGSGAGRRYTPT